MSIRMLDPRQIHGKHIFLDDMESLLYVIFYCGLMWQPHNLSTRALTTTISSFFDECFERHRGEMHGGAAKLANAIRRQYILTLVFDSTSLDDWLLTAMDFHSPLPMDRDKYKDKWSPEQLDAYWSAFLQSNTLEPNNRVEHTLDMFDHYGSLSASTVFSLPSSPAPRPPRKRQQPALSGGHEFLPEEPIAKRLRFRGEGASKRALSAPASREPRRSERFQGQEPEKAQQSAPSKPTVVSAAQSTTRGRKRIKASTRT